MADQTTEALFKELNDNVHPDYAEHEEEWRLYKAILGDEDFDLEKYLPAGKMEDEELYQLRIELSEWIPEAHLAVESLVSALYDSKPNRDLKNKRLESFMDDVDRKGTSFNEAIEDLTVQLLFYGTIRLLVNIPEAVPSKPETGVTRADEIAQRIQPFLIPYDPLSVIAWDVNEKGELTMVRIKEEHWGRPPKGGRSYVKYTKFIEYTTDTVESWEFVKLEENKLLLVKTSLSEHTMGRVPMVVATFTHEVKPLVGSSFIRYSSKADLQKFRAESDLAYDTHVHAHPTFWSKTEEAPKAIGVGSAAFIHLNPENNEEVGYVDIPTSAFEALMKVIDEKRRGIFRQAKTDPMGVLDADQATFQASGVARAWSFGTSEARVLSKIAGAMKNIEMDIFDVVLRIQGVPVVPKTNSAFAGEVQYPEEFNLASVDELLNQLETITEHINSPTLIKHLHKRVASAKLGDASSELHQKIEEEIENNDLLSEQKTKELESTGIDKLVGVIEKGGKGEEENLDKNSADG